MDMNQVARMIEWLDEERRRDKSVIATLEEQIAQQQEVINTITRRVGGVESDQTGLRASLISAVRESDIMDQLRGEMHQLIEGIEAKRLTAEREIQRRDEIAHENAIKPFREINERLEKLERVTEEIGPSRVERDRFATALAALQQRTEDVAKKLEEPERRIAFLEEQRRQDARRLSEAQSELPDLQRNIEALKAKLDLLEDMSLRNERKMIEMGNTERERREQMQQFLEQQTLILQQRDQRIEELTRSFTQYDDEMRRNLERFETWSETYRQMKKVLEDFERVGERLERRINEVAETQRLSEERFRQEWNSWNADDQKRWKQFTLTNDEAWRLHDKEYEGFRLKFNDAIGQLPPIYDQIERLWHVQRAQAQLYREHYQAIIVEYDQPSEKIQSNGNGRR
jgi:chromosome segregation ATPase